ncbi:DsbA family oxidoreductase [Brucella haematophila]|uniref:DsbA family protein n=1 Tax=Brucella haematophila TaxID=419474 RepID=A0ABX1DMY4_9HYPH|nr:DsbA family protein [Brucella haematophila]KAB2700363.1 DsbA family protein [Ochrobactrum sp. Kaboul]NKC04317.1 DsbA family protein [Brucella haematophila]TMV06194.1 DsbA family protein [Brucella haematophila]
MSENTSEKKITIDVVSDVVCPWCFLGRKRLENALAMLPEVEAEIRWRPFQLDPTLPPQGKDRGAYMREKFGNGSKIDDVHKQLTELGDENGIVFDFEAITRAPNTLDAHRVIHWAAQAAPDTQNRLVGTLFSLYFEQGQDIGDHEVLVDAAASVGMDAAVVARLLESDADKATIREEIDTANRIGVRGVPCFIIDQKYAVMGAQTADVLADAIRQTAEGFEPGISEDR